MYSYKEMIKKQCKRKIRKMYDKIDPETISWEFLEEMKNGRIDG